MAAINPKHVSAIGQEDHTLCWAACMAWWTRATDRINRDQSWLQVEFSGLWEKNADHALTANDMTWFLSDSRFRMSWEPLSSGVTAEKLRLYLSYGPVFLAYFDIPRNGNHVNCIYKLNETGPIPRVSVMEPAFSMNGDATYQGKHLKRDLSYYQSPGAKIFIACPKPW